MNPSQRLAAEITPRNSLSAQQLELERLVAREAAALARKKARLEAQLRATDIELQRFSKVFA